MLSLRLQTIADLVDKDLRVIDIGTDHAYIPIYLVKNNITDKVLAADISDKVIIYAKENIKKYNLQDKIKTIVSNGFEKVEEEFDVAIIAGMGTNTIKKILSHKNLPNTLIIDSHNDLAGLREFMLNLGYKIAKEIVIFDKNYYAIIKYIKGIDNLSEEEILFGKSENKDYFLYLKNKYQDLWEKSRRKEFQRYVEILDKIIEKIPA